MWEDEGNKKGGRWLLTLDKRDKKEGTLDNVWMETVSHGAFLSIVCFVSIFFLGERENLMHDLPLLVNRMAHKY